MGLLGRLDELIFANHSEQDVEPASAQQLLTTVIIIIHGNSVSINEKGFRTTCYIEVPIQQNLSYLDHAQGGALTHKSLSPPCGLLSSQHSSPPKLLFIYFSVY